MEGRAQTLGPPRNAPAAALASPLPEDGEEAVVRPDEMLIAELEDQRAAAAADARIDHGEENSVCGICASQRGQQVRRRHDAESRRIVQRVDKRGAGRTRREDCLYLADVKIGRAEVGEKDERPGAQAAAFFSLFFSGFLSAFLSDFFSDFCSSPAAAAAVSAARSVSMTSASGALSPLRKPILRMRV